MAGQRRLDHTAAAVASVVEDGVPGDFLETGVFRGGMSFVAAKTFELLGSKASGRRVHLADSFSGLPNLKDYNRAGSEFSEGDEGKPTHALDRQELSAHRIKLLNNNGLDLVKSSAKKLNLDMARLRFVPGYFNESLPKLLEEEGSKLQLAVLRLDGDAFASTLEAIELLYPRLSPGGYLIIDDFTDWSSCRAAIDLYRKKHNIVDPITLIPHKRTEIIRGAYWRKQPAPGQELCISNKTNSFRIADGYFPSKLVPLTTEVDQRIPQNVRGLRMAYIAGLRRPPNQTLYMCFNGDVSPTA